MKVIYIAGPFRGKNAWEIHNNILRAEAVIPFLLAKGYAPIVPHLITQNLQGLYPDKVYLDVCLELVRHSDEVFVLKGWKGSKGTIEEIRLASSLGKEIRYEENE